MVAVRRVTSIVAIAAVGLALGERAALAQEPRQRVSDTFTTQAPGAPSGRSFAVDFADPANPGGKPPAISRVELLLAEGARFDTNAVPRCSASDPALIARGATACPRETRVGRGNITVDTGFPEPARYLANDVTYFNAPGELVIFVEPRGTGGRLVLRGRVSGRRLTIDVPPLPGAPPDGGANWRERAAFAASRYLTTPPTCPDTGFWINRVTYTYRDGVRQTAESRSPCRRSSTLPSASGPRRETRAFLAVSRPTASARTLNRRRVLGIALRVDGTATDVRVRLVDRAGQTVAAAQRPSLDRDTRLWLRLRRRARPGLHRVLVTADGLRATKAVRLLR